MGRQRQLLKQQEIKSRIIETAREIISKEGVQGLSIRKITNTLDYSPGIIYHYFKDKNEIVQTLVNEGYGKILTSIRSVEKNEENPEEELREALTKYIKTALEFPEEYKAFMLNEDPSVLMRTGLLDKGIFERSPSLRMLYNNIDRGIQKGHYTSSDLELTAQIIWTSTFGLIIKLMIEKDISQDQVNRLINQHFSILFNGILKNREN